MALDSVIAALKAGGAAVKIDVAEGAWRATLGTPAEWQVEQGALADLAAVEAFFRAQAAVFFPSVVLP